MFLRNAWYVAAWGKEIGRALFERTIIDEPIVLFRKEDGSVAAIGNRCPHRFAPLSSGKLVGDRVQCGYHGLEFGADGRCAHNPHGEVIPKAAVVRRYPAVEKHGLVWLWMGEAQPDETKIPDFSCLTEEAGFTTVGGTIHIKSNYELITDNLMDLSHAEYVHEGILGSEAIKRGKTEVKEEGETLWSNRWCPDGLAPPAWDAAFDHYGKPVDHWLYMRWNAPAHMLLDVGITPTGKHRDDGVWVLGTDILTPETATTTHYFWGISRTYRRDDPATSELWRQAIKGAFEGQDKPMLESVQRMMGTRSFDGLNPVMIAPDAGAVRTRRVLAKMIADEGAAAGRAAAE